MTSKHSIELDSELQSFVLKQTNAARIVSAELVQSLWSGYGQIVRITLDDSAYSSVILKHINYPKQPQHPRGWDTDYSHSRKVRSYQVEVNWYDQWVVNLPEKIQLPRTIATDVRNNYALILMQDLAFSGFPKLHSQINRTQLTSCLHWLAEFHAHFMGKAPEGLWPTGTYWHLATRPDEHAEMADSELKDKAHEIDAILAQCRYQTIVHGDAKLANFCFSVDGKSVAAVDFQYVGGGCGMKDVAYFFGSCLSEEQCEDWQDELLDSYFSALKAALVEAEKKDIAEVIGLAWRPLYEIAWTDFYRFILGWMSSHKKANDYSQRVAERVLAELK